MLKKEPIQERFDYNHGKRAGFMFSYTVFTVGLFFILRWLGKLPENFTLFSMVGATAGIMLLAIVVKKLLQ